MDKPLDESYFVWLYRQVGSVEITNPSRTYWGLLKQLYIKEFVWVVPNDDNRAEDGRDLRQEFVDDEEIDAVDEVWMRLGCSMLEMLIGLSRRLSFEAGGESRTWFWNLLEKVHLDKFADNTELPASRIDDTLDRIIWRTYSNSGRGGLFPLSKTKDDQRRIEIWYQLSAYLLENGY
jgi:hypothetical protein